MLQQPFVLIKHHWNGRGKGVFLLLCACSFLLLSGCSFPLHNVSWSQLAEIPSSSDIVTDSSEPIKGERSVADLSEQTFSAKPEGQVGNQSVSGFSSQEKESGSIEEFELKRLQNMLAQDSWNQNIELKSWLERQQAEGEIPSKKGLIASPNSSAQNKKGNVYAEFNRSGKAKPLSNQYMNRDTEAAQRGPISLYRWYHGAIETEQSRPNQDQLKQVTARILLESPPQSLLATNAAIFLARLGVVKVKPFLLESILSENVPQSARCAAIEALGHLASCTNEELLQLVDYYQEREIPPQSDSATPQFQSGNPDLLIELLESLSERLEPTDSRCFTTALKSRSSSIRLTAVTIWRNHLPQPNTISTCPEEITRLVVDPTNEEIRIAALFALARWKYPTAERFLLDGLCDPRVKVRLAAIDALGIQGGETAFKHLSNRLRDPAPQIRAHVAAAFRKMGQKEDLFRFSEDDAYEVRIEVAKGLDDPTFPGTKKLVQKMLTDSSSRVQKTVLESLTTWSLAESAPILFEELASPSLQKRETAQQVLARFWFPAESFDYSDRRTDLRQTALQELRAAFDAEFGEEVRLEQSKDDPIIPVSSATSERVLQSLVDWETSTISERRLIAGTVLNQVKQTVLGPPTLQRLFTLGIQEKDTLILLTFFQIFEHFPGEQAEQFAVFHIENESPEIRRRCCILLGNSDDLNCLEELYARLDDTAPEIVVTAIQAIGNLGKTNRDRLESQQQVAQSSQSLLPQKYVDLLRSQLLRPELQIQIASATALCQWNCEEGMAALERLGYSDDPQTRLAVAQTAGSLAEPRLIPLLLSYLDENGSIRQAALYSLTKTTGKDQGNPAGVVAVPISEQVRNWKNWSKTGKKPEKPTQKGVPLE